MLILGGTKNVSQESLKLQDYVLPFGEQEPPPKQSWQDKKNIALLVASAYGSEIPDGVKKES